MEVFMVSAIDIKKSHFSSLPITCTAVGVRVWGVDNTFRARRALFVWNNCVKGFLMRLHVAGTRLARPHEGFLILWLFIPVSEAKPTRLYIVLYFKTPCSWKYPRRVDPQECCLICRPFRNQQKKESKFFSLKKIELACWYWLFWFPWPLLHWLNKKLGF